MKKSVENIRQKLSEKGLKVTPQRIAILETIFRLGSHPTADQIIAHIRQSHPNIASGTVYKVLNTLIDSQLIKRVTTDRDVMRFDGITDHHHHLYCTECDVIEDYVDVELDILLKNYFQKKEIRGFSISECVVQIKGTFEKC